MSARQFVALGTQSQAPTKKRAHNAGFLRWDTLGVLFDPGEGSQRQAAHAGLAANSITHICITHFHGDHCLGLAGMIQRLNLDRCPHPVHVFYPASGQRFFERLRFASIFAENATVVAHPIDREGVLWTGNDVTLSCLRLDHRVECFGYRLQEHDHVTFDPQKLNAAGVKGPLVKVLSDVGEVVVEGKTIRREDMSRRRPGQAMAYVMDTRPCPNALKLAQGADLLVMESTYANEHAHEAWEHAHSTAAQAAQVAKQAGVRRLVLTHFSQRYEDITPLLLEAQAVHGDVVAANDLTVVDVPRRVRVLHASEEP